MPTPHLRRAPRLEDADGRGLVPGDRLALTIGDETVTGTLAIDETYVVRLDQPTASGTVTRTLRHDPNGEIARMKGQKLAA